MEMIQVPEVVGYVLHEQFCNIFMLPHVSSHCFHQPSSKVLYLNVHKTYQLVVPLKKYWLWELNIHLC
jgi:hypothetical protein